MKHEQNMPPPRTEDKDPSGLIVVLVFLIGFPVAALLYWWLFK